MKYLDYLPYVTTKRQKEMLNALEEHQSAEKVAEAFGLSGGTVRNTLKRIKENAAKQGYSPDHDMVHPAPSTHVVKGVSTFYDEDGKLLRQWVKTDIKKENLLSQFEQLVQNLVSESLPQYDPVPFDRLMVSEDLMAVYPLGDPHIGMFAMADESGQDWTLETAREYFPKVFGRVVEAAPSCKQAVIVNLGDYFHADNVAGVTTRSGHHLDTDGNFLSMLDVGFEIMIYMINKALRHHEHVQVVTAIGNHDDTGAQAIQMFLKHLYANESRVTIHCTSNPYNFVRFGKCFFGVHHGHTTKADKLPLVMATDKPQDWGESEYRYWYTGHIHHDSTKEFAGCKVESFRTLAPKDAYASWGGYRAGQDTKAIILHRDFGEVERHTINIAQVKP